LPHFVVETATYTKRVTVVGVLTPDSGLVKVYVPQVGIVKEKQVTEGQSVKLGDILYVLSSDRYSSVGHEIQANLSGQVLDRRRSFEAELVKTRLIQRDELSALLRKISSLKDEEQNLFAQVEGQNRRAKLAEQTVIRYEGLAKQKYISEVQVQEKQEDLLEQRNRAQALQRDHLNVVRELEAQENDVKSMPLRHQTQLAQIERNITSTSQELTESEAKRQIVITATASGTATAVSAEVGQVVDANKPLISIIPTGSSLRAELYAPSNAVGFVKSGTNVLLRYEAYPYQKFKHAKGTITSVSKTSLQGNELPFGGNSSQPLYRINVALDSQTVKAYGKDEPLQAGMMLTADVLLEKRYLYEWILEPLFSLTGKL
jgi:membrane fusion protein